MEGLGSGPGCGTDGLGQYKTHGIGDSVWDGLWRPGGAFFQIGFGCVMSHHHIEGLCTFLFKFWRENSKWSSCQQLVSHKHSLQGLFKIIQDCAEPFSVVITHHTAKANLEKGSSWPPEAIPSGLVLSVALSNPNLPNPHLGPDPRPLTLHNSADHPIIN